MSKVGKVAIIVFFLFSIGAVISALKIIGNIEDNRAKIETLSLSLKEKETELAGVTKEKVALEEGLKREKSLREVMEKRLSQRIDELRKAVDREEGAKVSWKNKFDNLTKKQIGLERKYKEAKQIILNLKELLKGSSPDIRPQVSKTPSQVVSVPSEEIGGKIIAVVSPLLSVELNEDVVAGIRPTLFIYRKGKLVGELATKGIRYATLIAIADEGESLRGIRENDRVSLSLSPGATEIFNSPNVEGKVLNVINPGFLNIDLGKEVLRDLKPVLLVYRGGKLFKKIKLKDMDHLTVVVEVVGEANIKGVRDKDIVKIIR